MMLTTFVVDSPLDTVDANDGQTTLREAIEQANANAGADTVTFNIGGGGAQTITLASALPTVGSQITIDGSTQPGITIDATGVSDTVLEFRTHTGTILRDFAISNAQDTAVRLVGVSDSTIEDLDLSYVGSTASGTGLELSFGSSNNLVQNVTATNRSIGIGVSSGSNDNLLEQNDVRLAGSRGIELSGPVSGNVLRQNDASGSSTGISANVAGLGNQFIDNDLSAASGWGLIIGGDTQFVATGNDFTNSGDGMQLRSMDSVTVTPSATFDIDVSTVTGTGLSLVAFYNSTIEGLDLSYTGGAAAGTGLNMAFGADNNTIRNVTATNRSVGINVFGGGNNLFEQNNVSQASSVGISSSNSGNGNVFRQNDASDALKGIVHGGPGLGNQFIDNDLSGTGGYGLAIASDEQFVATGNDFTDSAKGLELRFMDGITLTPSATFNIDVSTVTDVGLGLVAVTNSTIEDLDLSYTGSTTSGNGLELTVGSDNNTVRNVTATNRSIGIRIASGSSGNLLEQNNVSDGSRGIELSATVNGNVLRQNDASGSSNTGISAVVSGLGNQFIDNDLSDSNWGLRIGGDTQFVATGNDFTNNANGIDLRSMDGISLTPSETFDIDVSSVTGIGLSLFDVTNSTIDGLDLSYVGGSTSGTGLQLNSSRNNTSDNNTISNLTVGNRVTGARLLRSSNTLIHCSQITNNNTGLRTESNASDVTIYESQIDGNGNGINAAGSSSVLAEDNYWGAADGPSNLGGSGDSYIGNVDADPFLTRLPDCLVDVQPVDVDIKPDNSENKVNAKSQGVIPVAIYTTADFDASTIVGSSVQLAGVSADHFALEDVDGDGDLDLILHFNTQAVITALGVDLASGKSISVEAELTGETIDEVMIQGFDTIEFFQPGKGKGKSK
ncbi:MAG: right-handed parallel beta-helix repeat-containing protein [Planctomycetales bacterium]